MEDQAFCDLTAIMRFHVAYCHHNRYRVSRSSNDDFFDNKRKFEALTRKDSLVVRKKFSGMRIEKIHHAFVYLPDEKFPTHVKVGENFLPLPSSEKGKLFRRVECDTSGAPGNGEWVDIYSGNRFEKLSLDNGVSYLYNSSNRTLYDPKVHVRILPHTEAIHDMREISKEIISLKFKKGETLGQCQKKLRHYEKARYSSGDCAL